ncbi:hypothetical protein Tco_1321263 [Tanacetum coccineum]
MEDSWKSIDLNKFVVHDAIADDILDDLLKIEWEKQERVKYDKKKVSEMKILNLLEQRISRVGKHLNKAKEKMDINKGKEKIVMEREVIIIESDTSYDYFPFQATFDESSDHNPFQATSNESSDHNPFQATSDESSDLTLFNKKATISSEIVQLYDDLSSDEQRTVYKGRAWSSSRNAAITKPDNPKSSSKHLAPTIPRTGLTYTTLVVPTKRPPLVTNCVFGLVAVTTWKQILNKEFGIKRSKKDVGGSSDVRRKGKRKLL